MDNGKTNPRRVSSFKGVHHAARGERAQMCRASRRPARLSGLPQRSELSWQCARERGCGRSRTAIFRSAPFHADGHSEWPRPSVFRGQVAGSNVRTVPSAPTFRSIAADGPALPSAPPAFFILPPDAGGPGPPQPLHGPRLEATFVRRRGSSTQAFSQRTVRNGHLRGSSCLLQRMALPNARRRSGAVLSRDTSR